MDELKWAHLTDTQGRYEADILKGYFETYGIEIETFQESLGQHIFPTALDILGNVQLYVPKKDLKVAKKLLKEYYNPPKPEKPKTIKKTTRASATQIDSKPKTRKKTK